VFSNVNDGVPSESCSQYVRNLFQQSLNSYFFGFLFPMVETTAVIGVYSLIIVFRLYKKCCNKKKKNPNNAKDKNQMEMQDVEIELE